ncbi:hypothetical protein HYDPIDRAFT_27271 [Hydnomerulius pinastri MD-312]|nr:hypothetical protein HYDPIDRAFT_27271 [Hydnomerulius pinastri MD-312]
MPTTNSATKWEYPPLDGSLLFPDLIDFHMKKNPKFPMFTYVGKDDTKTDISFLEFGRAAHRAGQALRPQRRGQEGEVVMIIANADTLLYQAIVPGAIIAGVVPFLVSPRNSPAGVVDMMEKTRSRRILTQNYANHQLLEGIKQQLRSPELVFEELPRLADIYPKLGRESQSDPFEPYPEPKTPLDPDSQALYIHSSGSTGFPKPIGYTYKMQIHWLRQPGFISYRDTAAPKRMAGMSLPGFHLLGVGVQLYVPIACLVTTAVYPPTAMEDPQTPPIIPTSNNIAEHLRKNRCNMLMIVPSILEQMADSPEAVEELKKLDFVVYGGGPLPEKIGNALHAEGVRVGTQYGGSEFGAPTPYPRREDLEDGDWLWMRFAEDVPIRWVPQGDGTYECQFLSTDNHLVAVENLPDIRGYATSDVFVKHPTKPNFVGRTDDVIILSSGEKTVPAPMENIVRSSELVENAVMFGRERDQVGILIEPRSEHAIDVNDEKAVAAFRNNIWPLVEEATSISPAFSRVFKEMILLTRKDKPMSIAGKGTVQRKATLKLYDDEINALYEFVRNSSGGNVSPPTEFSGQVLKDWLLEQAQMIRGAELDSGEDFLSATYLRNRIISAFRNSTSGETKSAAARISQNIIFENPTIDALATKVAALASQHEAPSAGDQRAQSVAIIEAMIDKYVTGLPGKYEGAVVTDALRKPTARSVVLMTGTTGGLGSYMLAKLIEHTAVVRTYAVNRHSQTSTTEERQRKSFADKELPVELLKSKKLEFVEADISQKNCGLNPEIHEELRKSVTTIIHNAYRLDFNLSLAPFEPNIRGTRNLIDLALSSAAKERIIFIFTSSIGAAQGWDKTNGPFPEEVQLDASVAVGSGYGESKYVCERILSVSGLSGTSLRIGQICGGPNGYWATTDWVPIIVKSSLALGALPKASGTASWMPAHEVASAVVDVAFAKEVPPQALNIVNPRPATWNDIVRALRDYLVKRKELKPDGLKLVPFGEWIELVAKRAEGASPNDLDAVPAIKLLEFLRLLALGGPDPRLPADKQEMGGGTGFSTVKSQRVSESVAGFRAPGCPEVHSWVDYWIKKGFL